MLGELHIKNIGIIDDITIDFDDGLNILTGETGAGKSLIIDSINAITGGKVSKDIIKYGEKSALVEACFFDKDNIILSREFFKNGRNICKINGSMVTLENFKELGESLIDIHGQHDNQSLLNERTHLELLDNFAYEKINELKNEYINLLADYRKTKIEIDNSFGDPIERARRIDLLKYQNEEIEASNLKEDEEEILNARRTLIMNYEKIASGLNNTYSNLSEGSIQSLENAIHEMNTIVNYNKRFEEFLNTMNDAYYSLKDVSSEIASQIDDQEFDENEQREIEERLDLIFSLKRKYGQNIKEILDYNEKIRKEIDYLENSDDIVNKLNEKLNSLSIKLQEVASKMREIRKNVAFVVQEKINSELQDLEMKKAYLEFEFKESESFLDSGMDIVQIMICTNVGECLKPLSKIASGGEISRVMLAIKTVLCGYDSVPTMIFDEIDTGISGKAAKSVAEKMKLIGKTHQVITVTHLPIIAAYGDANFFIEKIVENGKTTTKVTKLTEEETVNEIARILAGDDVTEAVLKHASEIRGL